MPTPRKIPSTSGGKGSYVIQIKVKGFDRCQRTFPIITTPAAARAAAVQWAKDERKRLLELHEKGRGAVHEDTPRLTVGRLINSYLEDPEVKQLRTFKDVDRLLTWWLKHHASTRVLDFSVLTIRAARDMLCNEKAAPATTNRHISQMRACWSWGISAGLIPQDRPWPQKLMLTEPAGRKRFLSDEELAAILKEAAADPVMYAAIMTSVATGLRQGELLRIEWKHLDLEGGKLAILKTKTDAPRTVHLPSTAVAALRALKKQKVVSSRHVFLNTTGTPLKQKILDKRWRRILTATKIKDFRWHDLRHSCASFLAQHGATLLEIGSVLGHKSPSTTNRYSHLVQGKPVTGHTELDALLGKAAKK